MKWGHNFRMDVKGYCVSITGLFYNSPKMLLIDLYRSLDRFHLVTRLGSSSLQELGND